MEKVPSIAEELAVADIFADDSEDERTFYGFSDSEIGDNWNLAFEEEDKSGPNLSPKQPKTKSGAFTFRLRVSLRSTPSTQQPSDEEEEEGGKDHRKQRVKEADHGYQPKGVRRDKVKGELPEMPVILASPPQDCGSDSAEDMPDSFLMRREQNIKANKAMLAQLMADLQQMPGGAGLLKKQAAKQKTKQRGSRPPQSGGQPRKNPVRVSRRQTRSMGEVESLSMAKDEELELSVEELLEVRRAPQRRGTPRPNRSKPHVIRPVEDITEEEIGLVADNMTDKVYNSITGSTCHQCRQKTVDTKTCCRSEDCRGIQGQFCGPCLRNRYGEDVRKALIEPEWKCPPCRGICNCSFCRQREGRCPTGILFPLAQYHGFSDVHSYLLSLRNKLKNEGDVDM